MCRFSPGKIMEAATSARRSRKLQASSISRSIDRGEPATPRRAETPEIPGRFLDVNLANAPTDLPVVLIFRILVKPVRRRYFAFPEERIRCIAASSRPLRRAYRDRHDTWVRDAMDRAVSPDERCRLRTAKSRGPDAPTLASSLPVGNVGSSGRHAVIGRRRRLTSPALRGERV